MVTSLKIGIFNYNDLEKGADFGSLFYLEIRRRHSVPWCGGVFVLCLWFFVGVKEPDDRDD